MAELNCILFGEDHDERKAVDRALEETGHVQVEQRIESLAALAALEELPDTDLLVALLGARGDAVLDALEGLPEPRPAIVLVGPPGHSEWILRAMRIGAREYLSPRFERRELTKVVESLTLTPSLGAGTRLAPLIGVFGAKGGVGATLVASQLAAALQAGGQATCLVDLNLRLGDVALHHDVQPAYTIADIARSKGAIDPSYLRSILETHASGVSILAAPRQPEDAELVEADHVERTLALLRSQFDAVVVDMPAQWDDTSLRALDMATLVYLVYAFDLPSLAHARQQLQLLSRLGIDAGRARLLANRCDTKGGVRPREAAEFLGRSEDVRIPSDYPAVMDAIASGRSIASAAPHSGLGPVFAELARETREHCGLEAPMPPAEGRFTKLRKLIGRG